MALPPDVPDAPEGSSGPGEVRRRLDRLAGRALPPRSSEDPPQSAPRAMHTALSALHRRISAMHTPREAWLRPVATPEPVAAPTATKVEASVLPAERPPDGSPRAPAAALAAPSHTPKSRADRLDQLRRQVGARDAEPPAQAQPRTARLRGTLVHGVERPTPYGQARVRIERYAEHVHHGDRALGLGLRVDARALALLDGDPRFLGFDPAAALFLDLEATGLAHGAGTLPFLVGAAHYQGDTLVLEQWLMATPDEEQAVLHEVAARVAQFDWLVTFNGRTYDVPLLCSRYRLQRMDAPFEGLAGHLDLLPLARRGFRGGLPNKRLGTLERLVLGLERHEDVSGAEVPECYRRWLHDGDPGPLGRVVDHNRLDVLTLVTLLHETSHRVTAPEATLLRDPEAALALAERGRRAGQFALARRIVEAATLVPETRDAAVLAERRLTRAERRAERTLKPLSGA